METAGFPCAGNRSERGGYRQEGKRARYVASGQAGAQHPIASLRATTLAQPANLSALCARARARHPPLSARASSSSSSLPLPPLPSPGEEVYPGVIVVGTRGEISGSRVVKGWRAPRRERAQGRPTLGRRAISSFDEITRAFLFPSISAAPSSSSSLSERRNRIIP